MDHDKLARRYGLKDHKMKKLLQHLMSTKKAMFEVSRHLD